MSQERLARLALTSTRTIARIEARQVNPRSVTLDNIGVALGVRADFFVLLRYVREDNRRTQMIEAKRRRERASLVIA